MQVQRSARARRHQGSPARRVLARIIPAAFALMATLPAVAGTTLDRIKETGRIKFGYLVDARPFSFRNDSGAADGYAVALCQQIAAQMKAQMSSPNLAVEWVPVTLDTRLSDVERGNVDLLCAPTSVTLERREDVAFSIPIFEGGNRAVLRNDSAVVLRRALAENPELRPVWRGEPAAKVLRATKFAVVSGTTTEDWLKSRRTELQVDAKIVPVANYREGVQALLNHQADVLFGESSAIVGVMDEEARKNLTVFDRKFTHELMALAQARDNDDFRLLVDRALTKFYDSPEFRDLYAKWNGPFDADAHAFFLSYALAQR